MSASAETAASAAPKYKLTDVKYTGMELTGKLVHQDGTPVAEKIKVRGTFYIVGNYYMATSATADADGNFKITAFGPIIYITALAYVANADGTTTRLDVTELYWGD